MPMTYLMKKLEQYATKFNIDRPNDEPTDTNLCDALRHCALPAKRQWFGAIRSFVIKQRSLEETFKGSDTGAR